jgi:uncharacterized membrane protein
MQFTRGGGFVREFLRRKGVDLSPRTYFITALSYMALGLFSSLIIGLIIKTAGEQLSIPFLMKMGELAQAMVGPAIGVAVAYGLQAPRFVVFASLVTGAAGYQFGGAVGSYLAALLGAEFGKLIAGETKLEIILTPFVTIFSGYLVAYFVGPPINAGIEALGRLIMWATELKPFLMGIVVSTLMGLALTAPISSAAISIMLGLEGIAAGAATIGCCAQMIGFAVASYRENGISGLISQGLGTSMLQVGNIIKNPLILLPPTIAGIILAPFASVVFLMENNRYGGGMGTSGLVGQLMTFEAMGFSWPVLWKVLLLHFIAPAIISFVISEVMRKLGWIKPGDMKLE